MSSFVLTYLKKYVKHYTSYIKKVNGTLAYSNQYADRLYRKFYYSNSCDTNLSSNDYCWQKLNGGTDHYGRHLANTAISSSSNDRSRVKQAL